MGDQRRIESYTGQHRSTYSVHLTPAQQRRREQKLLRGLARSGQVQVRAVPVKSSPGRAEAITPPVDQAPGRVWSAEDITNGVVDRKLQTEATARFLERKGFIGRSVRRMRHGRP
jgi:hypothetical protein